MDINILKLFFLTFYSSKQLEWKLIRNLRIIFLFIHGVLPLDLIIKRMNCCADIYCEQYPGPSKRAKKTVQVETNKVLLKVSIVLFSNN